MDKPVIELVMDSGAYSAYTKKVPIDIDAYADFCLKNLQHISTVVNLDVIDPTNTELAGKLSLDNFLYLKQKRGLLTMPVFHANEPLRYLDTMLDEAPYIGLSGSMAASSQDAFQWYKTIFQHVTDSKGYPVAKFHAFGDTTPQALLTYPWHSADSTTWYVAGGLAARMVVNGKYVQFRGNSAKDGMNSIHPNEEVGMRRDMWEEELWNAGLNPDACMKEMRESDKMLVRAYMNAIFFLELQEKTKEVTCFKESASLFITKKYEAGGIPAIDPINLHFVITESSATRALAVLTQLGVTKLLISHYYNNPKQWNELLVPYLYNPLELCKTDEKLRTQCEIFAPMLRNPVIV